MAFLIFHMSSERIYKNSDDIVIIYTKEHRLPFSLLFLVVVRKVLDKDLDDRFEELVK